MGKTLQRLFSRIADLLDVRATASAAGDELYKNADGNWHNAKGELWAHRVAGVTGTGTTLDPFIGFDAAVHSMVAGQTMRFGDYVYKMAVELWPADSQVVLKGTGKTILRSSEAAHLLKTITSITIVIGNTGFGNLCTVTAPAHGMIAGDSAIIENVDQAEYNGCYTVYAPTSDTFQIYIKGSPGTGAAGVGMTVRKARRLIHFGKAIQGNATLDICWFAGIEGFILDGEGQIEVGMYLRNWQGGSMSKVEFRNFTHYNGVMSLNVNCRFSELRSIFNGVGAGHLATSTPANFFRFGEKDPNPVSDGGDYNLTLEDNFLFGTPGTIYDIPFGFEVRIINGNAGGAGHPVDFGAETQQCVIKGTDLECLTGRASELLIGGWLHEIDRVNSVGTTITVRDEGNAIAGPDKGKHTISNLLGCGGIQYNCNAYSKLITTSAVALSGAHLEKLIQYDNAGTLIHGKGIQGVDYASDDGNIVRVTMSVAGDRIFYVVTGFGATYFIDSSAGITDYLVGTLEANYSVKIVNATVWTRGTINPQGLTIQGAGQKVVRVTTTDGSPAVYELFAGGDVRGYMAGKNGKLYFSANGVTGTYADADLLAQYNFLIYQTGRGMDVFGRLTALTDLMHVDRQLDKVVALVDAAPTVWDMLTGDLAIWTISANHTLSLTNLRIGTYVLWIIQGAGGSHVPTFPASVKWPGDVVPTWSIVAGKRDIVTMATRDGITFDAVQTGAYG